jgi:Ca2+-transporting ATPase
MLRTLFEPNRAFWWIVAGTALALLGVIYVPAAAEIFRFAPLRLPDLALAALAGIAGVAWYDLVKLARRA